MKKSRVIPILLVVLVVVTYGWWILASGEWFYTHRANAPNRAALLKIRNEIRIGDGYEKALNTYWQNASEDLRLYSGSPEIWSISMPSELGASEWVLHLDFKEGKVSGIKVRTSDGPHPPDAPEDLSG